MVRGRNDRHNLHIQIMCQIKVSYFHHLGTTVVDKQCLIHTPHLKAETSISFRRLDHISPIMTRNVKMGKVVEVRS